MRPEQIHSQLERIKTFFPPKDEKASILHSFSQAVLIHLPTILDKVEAIPDEEFRLLTIRRLETLFRYVFFRNTTVYTLADRYDVNAKNISQDLQRVIILLWDFLPPFTRGNFNFNLEDVLAAFINSKRRRMWYPHPTKPGKNRNTFLIEQLIKCQDPIQAQQIVDQMPPGVFGRNKNLSESERFLVSLSSIKLPFTIDSTNVSTIAEELKKLGVPIYIYAPPSTGAKYYSIPTHFQELFKERALLLHQEKPELFSTYPEVVRGIPQGDPVSLTTLITSEKYQHLFPLFKRAHIFPDKRNKERLLDFIPQDCPFLIYRYKSAHYIQIKDADAFVKYLKAVVKS